MDIAIGIGMSAVLFLMLRERYSCPGARMWSYSVATITAGMIFLLSRLFAPVWLSVCAGNSLLLLGFILHWLGFRQYTKTYTKYDLVSLAFPLLLTIVLSIIMILIPDSIAVRVKVVSPTIAIVCALSIATAVSHRKKQDVGSVISVIGLLLIIFMMCFRFMHAGELSDSGSFHESSPALLMVFLTGVSMLLLGFSILMSNYQWLVRRLHMNASHDSLTGVLNRNALHETYETLEVTGKLKDDTWSVALIDVDLFKQVNDQYGHQIGDKVLTHIVRALQKTIRHDDILVRYGGEEFVAILPKCDSFYATKWAKRVNQAVMNSPFIHENVLINNTISIGIATANEQVFILDELIANADKALYEAKNAGRNRICFYEYSDLNTIHKLLTQINS